MFDFLYIAGLVFIVVVVIVAVIDYFKHRHDTDHGPFKSLYQDLSSSERWDNLRRGMDELPKKKPGRPKKST